MGANRRLLAVAAGLVGALALGSAAAAQTATGDLRQFITTIEPRPPTTLELRISSLDGSGERAISGNEVAVSLAADVLFAFDSAELEGDAAGRIAEVADELASQATGTVQITGHTDDVGTRSYNQALSEDRAQAVAEALAPVLDDTELTFEVSGRAFDEPLVDDDTEEARARNRRVEIRYERG
ncbi:MAG: OmpA family protein [Ilumatobacteraceae bacterium]